MGVFAGLAGTAAWFGAIWLYLVNKADKGIAQQILDLSLPDFGNFLAGAFAPVAFFWLAYSVIMQRHELGLQRNELKLSRIALEAQITEQKNTAAALSSQTSVMSEELKIRNSEINAKRIENEIKNRIIQFIKIGFYINYNFEASNMSQHLKFKRLEDDKIKELVTTRDYFILIETLNNFILVIVKDIDSNKKIVFRGGKEDILRNIEYVIDMTNNFPECDTDLIDSYIRETSMLIDAIEEISKEAYIAIQAATEDTNIAFHAK